MASHAAATEKRNNRITRRSAQSRADRKTRPAAQTENGKNKNSLPAGLERILLPEARSYWNAANIRAYTPEVVESILRLGISGDLASQWQLFQLMEDTWPRLCKNLLELKRAVTALDRTIEPATIGESQPNPEAIARSILIEHALTSFSPNPGTDENGVSETIFDLLDAWGKGISVLEIDWELRCDNIATSPHGTTSYTIAARSTRWISPYYYTYSPSSNAITLRAGIPGINPCIEHYANTDSFPLPKDKFLVAIRKARTGSLPGAALLRTLAYWWVAANFTAEWLLNYAQIFGQPIRWITYDQSAAGLLPRLESMLQSMGNSPWAAIPAGASLEIHEAVRAASDNPQAYVRDLADRLCDILILGQTLTTDTPAAGTGSRALGQVHNTVREEVITAAAHWVDDILNSQLVPALLRLNFGDNRLAPRIRSTARRESDPLAMAQRDTLLLEKNVQLPRRWFYKRHNIPDPDPTNARLITPPKNNGNQIEEHLS